VVDPKIIETFLSKIEKKSEKGQLIVKDDMIKVEVKSNTYEKLFELMGGWSLTLPLFVITAVFTYLEFYRKKILQEWANLP